MVTKPFYRNHFKFLACIGTSSEPEITALAVGARELKLTENFTGILGNGLKVAAWCCSSMLYLIIQK